MSSNGSHLFLFTDELRHDAHVAQACMQQVLQHLKGVLSLRKVIIVSNRCAAQFQSKLPFPFLSHTEVLDSAVSIKKVSFGSHHEKNDTDWLGGSVMQAVTHDIASGRVTVTNACDMFDH